MLLYDSAAVQDVHHHTLVVEIAPPGLNFIISFCAHFLYESAFL